MWSAWPVCGRYVVGIGGWYVVGNKREVVGKSFCVVVMWYQGYRAKHCNPKESQNNVTNIVALNPFTPESDQCQISPAASPEILHHTVRRTWLFIAYSDER